LEKLFVDVRRKIRFSQPDRAALIKEYDGQVKAPEDRKDNGTDTKSTARRPLSFTMNL